MTTSGNPLAGRRFVDEAGNPIVPGRKLGEGGEGAVHLVDGDTGSVLKIWHPGRTPQDADAKIRHLVNNPVAPDLGATWHITWPQRMVMENGVIAGYTMPILNPNESWEPIVEYYNRRAAQSTGTAQAREIQIDDRVRMARNLALGFRAVHDAGYVIGDVNEKNVEVNRQNDIAMVDCDSYGFTDAASGRTFSNGMGRPEFQAPEAQSDYNNRTQEQDLFGLAVVIFHLLTGYHPYTVNNQPNHALPGERISNWLFAPAGRGVTAPDPYNEAWNALTDQQKELFLRCFDRAHQGEPRPTPEEWVEALMEMPNAAPAPTRPAPSPPPTATIPAAAPAGPTRRRYYSPPTSTRDAWIYWVSAFAGYGALLPLMLFNQFRPFWWLALILVAGALFYLPVRKLLEPPITGLRWTLISVASLVSLWFLLGLIGAALSVWPWWLWLGLGLGTAFILLVPARGRLLGSLRSPNAWQRWIAIGAVSLLVLFILVGMGSAVFREWEDWRYRRSLEAAANAASADRGAVASAAGNVVNASAGGGIAPVVVPTDTPEPTPTGEPTVTAPPPTATTTPTDTPTPEPTPTLQPSPTPIPTNTPEPTPTPSPTLTPTPIPPSTPTLAPLATRTPNQWLIQHPAQAKITNSSPGTHVLLQGCYLGNNTSARKFRLASWDVWDPSRYGSELKFVKIITNTGANLRLEPGACYEARLVKQVNTDEEYVCLDQGSVYPQQTPCANPRENEVIPTFILYPDSADNPDDFTNNFVRIPDRR